MKLITAIIKPFKLDEVREARTEYGVYGITITEVKGIGWQRGHTELYRGAEDVVDDVPKIKIKVEVLESQVDQILKHIVSTYRTGKIGDRRKCVTALEQ